MLPAFSFTWLLASTLTHSLFMKQMHLLHFFVEGCEAFRDARCCEGALFLIPREPGAHHRGGTSSLVSGTGPTFPGMESEPFGSRRSRSLRAPAPGQRLGLNPWWREGGDTMWAEAKVIAIHSLIYLLDPEPRDSKRPLAGLGLAWHSGMRGDAFYDCSQGKRHLLPGLCLRALLTVFLTSYS